MAIKVFLAQYSTLPAYMFVFMMPIILSPIFIVISISPPPTTNLPSRESLSQLMKTRSAELDVKLLLFAIQKTTSFEKLLAQRFINSDYMETVSHC